MKYFDASAGSADLQLLPRQLRDHEDVGPAAVTAEADVIAHYTFSTAGSPSFREGPAVPEGAVLVAGTEDLYVGLRGYAPDAAAAAAPLRDALTAEIARVIRWRLAQWARTPGLMMRYKTGPEGEQYTADAEARFGPGFGSALAPFDARPALLVF